MNRPIEPASGSSTATTTLQRPQHHHHQRLLLKSILLLSTYPTLTSPLPLSNILTGGYLTFPPSRNYLAYTSSSTLPSALQPLNLLPEIEPTPHSLKSSQYYNGGTCGSADGVRNYDTPLSRLHTLLPLNVQSSFSAGSEIEVSISMYGLDAGGHFEFHVCPLDYPERPTEDCFEKYPLEFVRDVNYGAVRDERYRERAYLPLVGAFGGNSNNSSGDGSGMKIVVDDRENPVAGSEMMEFRYVLKLPKDIPELGLSSLIQDSPSDSHEDGGGMMVANSQGLSGPTSSQDYTSLADHFTQGGGGTRRQRKNRFVLRRRRAQSVSTPITGQRTSNLQGTNITADPSQQQWYATQVDNGYTVSSVPTVPIGSIVTDGNGTTIITTLEGVTVLTGGAAVPASMTTTWGDAAIYGEGIDLHVSRPPAPAVPAVETSSTTTTSTTSSDWPVNDIVPQTNLPQQEVPQTVSASIPPSNKPESNSTKYVLLRWHYQTSLDCYPEGYDSYPWPEAWGTWSAPWAGQCNSNGEATSTQDHYWNCAEIQIVSSSSSLNPPTTSPVESNNEMVTNSQQQEPPKPQQQTQNDPPQAMPDMILVGKNELAYLNVLANDTDPNGDELHLVEVDEAMHGYVALMEGKEELIYAPDEDFEGYDSFEYTVCDSYGQCDTAKIDVLVGSNSDLIFAKDDMTETTGAEPVVVDVIANDVLQRAGQSNVQSSDPLIVTEVSGTKRGTCEITSDNQVRYQASEAFLSSVIDQAMDRCRYIVCLGEDSAVCDEGWLSIVIFAAEAGASDEDTSVESFEDVSVEIVPQDQEEEEGELEIAPADSLHNDMTGGSMEALLSNIGSDGSGDVVALDDTAVTDSHDEPFTIDVLKNDEYVGTAYIKDVSTATSGKCTLTDDNQVLYTPTPGFIGYDRCQYTVCVADDVCDEGRIKIQVMILPQDTSFSSNIVTNTDKATVESGKPLVIDVVENDVALGSSRPLVVTNASPSLHGKCTVTNDNKVEYTSNAGFTGWDRCQYTVCVGKTCNVGQIGVKVFPVGSSPVADISPGELQANSGEAFSLSMAKTDAVTVEAGKTTYLDVLANDIKPNEDELSIESVTHPNFGNAQIVFGRVEYTPVDGFVGLDSFEYTVCDEGGNCDSASIMLTVISEASSNQEDHSAVQVNDSSNQEVFAEDDEAIVESSQVVIVDVIANDHTTSDEPLELSSIGDTLHGSCVLTSDNQIEYSAPDGFVGLDRCTYSVCSGGVCEKGRLEITVTAPVAEASDEEKDTTPAGSINVSSPGDADVDQTSPVEGIDIISPGIVEEDEEVEALEPSDENEQSSFGGITVMSQSVSINDKRMHADDDSVVTPKNVAVLLDVTLNDFMVGVTDFTIAHAGGSQHGTCVIEGSQVRYTPNEGFIGQDRCGYIACGGSENNCDEGIIRIKVVSESTMMKHDKNSPLSPASSTDRSSSAKLCSQAAMHHKMRKLRGRTPATIRRLETGSHSSCVGASLVTTDVTPTQTITYTSTYHAKASGSTSPQTKSFDLHSKIRSASKQQVDRSYIDTEIVFPALADATIIPGFPDQNFGSSQSMLVSSALSKSGRHDAFLKFDTSSVDASVCSDGVVGATLTLYSLTSSAQGGTFQTIPNAMAWSEGDVTWNNAPTSNGIVLDSLGRVQAKTFYDIDVSSALRLGKSLSIHILPDPSADVSAQYATKDHSDSTLHPVLRISCISFDGPEIYQ